MSSNEQPSTLKSVVDGITGAAQNVVGSVTGSTTDQVRQLSLSVNEVTSHYTFTNAIYHMKG